MTATSPHVHGMLADLLAFRKQRAAPFEERSVAFLAGLRALTRRTGVAVTSTAAGGAWNQIEMIDAADCPRGHYLQDDTDLEWVRNQGDYAEPMPWGDRVERHGRGIRDALDAEMSKEAALAIDAAGKALFGPTKLCAGPGGCNATVQRESASDDRRFGLCESCRARLREETGLTPKENQ